jgi:WNK lysine deficient protein kinase
VLELANDNLQRHLRSLGRALTLDELRGYAGDILRGLVYLHTREPALIHRDLKPDNILVFERNDTLTLKIGDIGLARHVASVTMSQVGSLFFMAPEILGGRYDCRVDVYSFGMMMAAILSVYCAHLESNNTVYDITRKTEIVEAAVQWLNTHDGRDLAVVVSKCCELDSAQRYTSTEALSTLTLGQRVSL